MTEHRRSFKRAKSLSDDSCGSFQNPNFSIASSGVGEDGIHSTQLNDERLMNSDASGFRTPLLNRLNNQSAQNNSGSSSSTIGGSSICGSTILPTIQASNTNISNNPDNLNYCEVYYLSPSKRRSKENLHYSNEQKQQQQHQLQRRPFQKYPSETNYAILQQQPSNMQQQKSLHDTITGNWSTVNTLSNNINKNRNNPACGNQRSSTATTTSTRNATNNSSSGSSNKRLKCRTPEVFNTNTLPTNSITLSSLGCSGLRTLTGNSIPSQQQGIVGGSNSVDQNNLDNFDICSHYSDSVAIITKNQPPGAMQFIKNNLKGDSGSSGGVGISGSRSNNVTFSNCTEEHYLHRHRSPSFSNHIQFQHQPPAQHQNSITTSGTLTRPTTPHSNRGSLRRSKGRSNQSLCSCDAGDSTEIAPDPNRPLYQYSLDRKKKKHTYTCEQNAQILMRLEREKNLRNNSCGNLSTISTIGKSSSRKSLDKQGNEVNLLQNGSCDETSFDYPDLNNSVESDSATDVDIPPPPPPPSGRKLSFKQLHDNFMDGFTAQTTTITSTNPTVIKQQQQQFQSQKQNLNSNYQHHPHPTTTNTVSFNISNNTNISHNNNSNNNNSNINNNSSNNNSNNNNNNTNNNSNSNNNNNNNCLKSASNILTGGGNLGCNIGEQMLNDCTSTILNCANVGQLMVASAIASATSSNQQSTSGNVQNTNTATSNMSTSHCNNTNKPDLCQMGNNSKTNNILNTINKHGQSIQDYQHHQQKQQLILSSDNNGNMKRFNQENIPLTPYPFIRDDSYLPCFKSSNSIKNSNIINAEESVFFYHQEPPQYKPNFDNRPSLHNNFGSNSGGQNTGKYNTIGPSNCYAKQLANHYHSNDLCNFSHLQAHQTKAAGVIGSSSGGVGGGGGVDGNIGGNQTICNGGTNLINGRYFSQSLTNFALTDSSGNIGESGGHSHGSFDVRNSSVDNYQHWHSHNYHDLGATILPYTQFRTSGGGPRSGTGIAGGGCGIAGSGIGNSTTTVNGGISCSFDNSMISCSFTTIGSGNSGLKGISNSAGGAGGGIGIGGGKDQIHQHSTCSNLKGSSTGLSGDSGSSLMPWKHRQCPSRGSSSSATNSLRFDFAKHWLAVSSLLLLIGAASVAVPLALRVAASAPFEERLQIATQILETVPLIDGHNDLPWNIRKFLHNKLNDFNFDEDLRNVTPWAKSQWSHTDLQRLRSGRVSAQFWAAYVPCEAQHRDAVQLTLEQIDVIKRLTERYSVLTTCTSASDIIEAHKDHKLCSLTGVEGGHSLGGSLAVLRTLYAIGVRYMTLTSTCHTPWADSSYADAPTFNVKHGGLTSFGKTIIREMNRLGMIVDLSHVSTGTMRDALSTTEAPVIFSHSSAYELCNSSRNVKDDILESLAKNGGIVMVNFYSKFLSCNENSTVHDAVAHINHIRRVAGIDHVGLGAGFDGINFTPKGLEDVSTYPTLFAELLGEGWSVEELKKLAGENFLRVMREVEKIRDEKKRSGVRPYEDHPNFRTEDPFNCTSS